MAPHTGCLAPAPKTGRHSGVQWPVGIYQRRRDVKLFVRPGTKIVVLAAFAAKGAECIARPVHTVATAAGAAHDAGRERFRHTGALQAQSVMSRVASSPLACKRESSPYASGVSTRPGGYH